MSDLTPAGEGPPPNEPEIRAFLIADVRGYTAFTQTRGDEAAARLAARFAAIVREVVERSSGTLLELRGDEALVVFTSPRASLRAAVALQTRLVEATEEDPMLPLRVGIGLDVGEAVPVEGGFRGGALNLAARLCSSAGPGQVLASEELTHVARLIPGVRYIEPRGLRVKGMSAPVRAVEVLPTDQDPARRLAEIKLPEPHTGPTRKEGAPARLRRAAVASVTAVAVAVVGIVLLASRNHAVPGAGPTSSPASPIPLPRGVIRIDPTTATVVATVELENPWGAVSFGGGFVWVQTNTGIDKINVDTNKKVSHIDDVLFIGSQPQGDESGLWATTGIAADATNRLAHIDASTNHVDKKLVPPGRAAVYAEGFLWLTQTSNGINPDAGKVWRVDPQTDKVVSRYSFDVGPFASGFGDPPADWLAVGEGAVWFLNLSGTVTRLDPETGNYQALQEPADGVAVGEGAVWLLSKQTGRLTKINPVDLTEEFSRVVGGSPSALATTQGAVWVVDREAGELLKVNPFNGSVVAHIYLGPGPGGIAADDESVWVVR